MDRSAAVCRCAPLSVRGRRLKGNHTHATGAGRHREGSPEGYATSQKTCQLRRVFLLRKHSLPAYVTMAGLFLTFRGCRRHCCVPECSAKAYACGSSEPPMHNQEYSQITPGKCCFRCYKAVGLGRTPSRGVCAPCLAKGFFRVDVFNKHNSEYQQLTHKRHLLPCLGFPFRYSTGCGAIGKPRCA